MAGGVELPSLEGTTQGCPLAMAMYALGILPLIDKLRPSRVSTCRFCLHNHQHAASSGSLSPIGDQKEFLMPPQAWFADDSQAAGSLGALRLWWDTLNQHGPAYEYFPKPSKTFLVVKPGLHESARKIFGGTGVQISEGSGDDPTGGQRDLGAAIGSKRFVSEYLIKKIAMDESDRTVG